MQWQEDVDLLKSFWSLRLFVWRMFSDCVVRRKLPQRLHCLHMATASLLSATCPGKCNSGMNVHLPGVTGRDLKSIRSWEWKTWFPINRQIVGAGYGSEQNMAEWRDGFQLAMWCVEDICRKSFMSVVESNNWTHDYWDEVTCQFGVTVASNGVTHFVTYCMSSH